MGIAIYTVPAGTFYHVSKKETVGERGGGSKTYCIWSDSIAVLCEQQYSQGCQLNYEHLIPVQHLQDMKTIVIPCLGNLFIGHYMYHQYFFAHEILPSHNLSQDTALEPLFKCCLSFSIKNNEKYAYCIHA